MNTDDKGKASMELTEGDQPITELENIMINVYEYYEAVDEKNELIEEVVIDLRVDFGKSREISTHLYRTVEELKENFSEKDLKNSILNFLNYPFVPSRASNMLQMPL